MKKNNKQKYSHFKLNAVLILIVMTFAVVIAYFLIKKNNYVDIVVKVTEQNVLYSSNGPKQWYLKQFRAGQKEYNGLGKTTAELMNVYYYDIDNNQKAVYLSMRILANFNSKTKTSLYKGKSVIVGAPIKIELESALVEGLIVNINSSGNNIFSKIMVEAKLYDSEKFIADTLQVGDKIIDANGSVKVEIIEKHTEAAVIITSDNYGRLHLQRSPSKKDIYLKLLVNADEHKGEYYLFNDIRIIVNEILPLNFKKIRIYPQVQKISIE